MPFYKKKKKKKSLLLLAIFIQKYTETVYKTTSISKNKASLDRVLSPINLVAFSRHPVCRNLVCGKALDAL